MSSSAAPTATSAALSATGGLRALQDREAAWLEQERSRLAAENWRVRRSKYRRAERAAKKRRGQRADGDDGNDSDGSDAGDAGGENSALRELRAWERMGTQGRSTVFLRAVEATARHVSSGGPHDLGADSDVVGLRQAPPVSPVLGSPSSPHSAPSEPLTYEAALMLSVATRVARLSDQTLSFERPPTPQVRVGAAGRDLSNMFGPLPGALLTSSSSGGSAGNKTYDQQGDIALSTPSQLALREALRSDPQIAARVRRFWTVFVGPAPSLSSPRHL